MASASTLVSRVSKDIFNPTLYRRVYDLWFAGLPSGATSPPKGLLKRWFGGGSGDQGTAFDSKCSSNFKSALESIGPTQFPLQTLNHQVVGNEPSPSIASPFIATLPNSTSRPPATDTFQSALGLIILLDQITRNIFRHDKKLIFGHYDRISIAVAREIQANQYHLATPYASSAVHQTWFYMPFMHSEVLADHDEFTKGLEYLRQKAKSKGDEDAVKYLEITEKVEKDHRDILERFGRYPYRNEALGREITEEERAWFAEGGKSF